MARAFFVHFQEIEPVRFLTFNLVIVFLVFGATTARPSELGTVYFNQNWIEDKARSVDVDDPRRVFSMVFAQLPDVAKVYPTENYYYFRFSANGRDYAGNFRLHPEERDEGLINFAYFDTSEPTWFRHLLLGEADDVLVKRRDALKYSVAAEGREVLFALNPVRQDEAGVPLSDSERFVGRGFDESGISFLLIFDETANSFVWVLDPEQATEITFAPLGPDTNVHVGSGFVFLQQPAPSRHVLIAIDAAEVVRNTYFDGPFDQLPDNWLPETDFQSLAIKMSPALAGMMNERGEFKGGESRIAIAPYMQYSRLSEVWERVEACRVKGRVHLPCALPPPQ